jgi:nucleoside-diphosphate-sugar epimerase
LVALWGVGSVIYFTKVKALRLLLTGATGQIGDFLLQHLHDTNIDTLAISRQAQVSRFDEKWVVCDLLYDDPFAKADDIDVWVHAGLLTLTLPWLKSAAQAGVKRLVSFSTTSVFTKIHSSSDKERELIESIREAETAIAKHCEQLGIHWTILRPTLIYGRGTDQNISFIVNMIQRFGFFPIAGDGSALRQPVHADDLALAVLSVIDAERTFNRAYNLSGGEIMTYQAMVERVFASLQKKPRIVRINSFIYKCAITMIRKILPRYAFVQPSMVDRMLMDMTFDSSDANKDFGYNPRAFQP